VSEEIQNEILPPVYLGENILTVEKLDSTFRVVRISGYGRFTLSDSSVLTLEGLANLYARKHNIYISKEDREIFGNFVRKLLHARQSQRSGQSQTSLDEFSGGFKSLIERAVPIVDVKSGESFFIDEDTKELLPLHEDVYLGSNNRGIESRKDLLREAAKAIVEFNPNINNKIYTKELAGRKILTVNIYDDAPWLRYAPTSPNIPELIENIFLNAFPKEPDREYVYQWFYRAVCATKNETILCLIGAQGIGKDFLINLLGHGVGRNFFQKADQSILDDKFNSQVRYCRLLFLDEVKVSSIVEENKLKGLTSTNISYQAKGKDASTIDSYINIVVANNNKDAIPLKPGDRRYSVPKLGTTRLEAFFIDKYGKEAGLKKMNELSEYIYKGVLDANGNKSEKPHEDIINFFHWLKNKYDGTGVARDGNTAYQSDYYHELTLTNMTEWQKRMYEVMTDLEQEPIIYLKDIKKTLDVTSQTTFPNSTKTIEKFLDSYYHDGKVKMAEVGMIKIGSKSEKAIVLTDRYLEEKYPFEYEEKIERKEKIISGKIFDNEPTKTPEAKKLKVIDAGETADEELL